MLRKMPALFALLLLLGCTGSTTGKKPDPPKRKQKGLLRVASFEFRLEDTNSGSSAPFRRILSNNGRIRLKKEVLFTNNDLINAYMKNDFFGEKTLLLVFSLSSAARLRQITGANTGKKLAIIVDGEIWIAPTIHEEIPEGVAQITGRSVQPYLRKLVERLSKTGK